MHCMSVAKSIWKFYKIARWFVLLALIAVVLLALRKQGDRPDPLEAAKAKESAESFSTKLAELETARRDHKSDEAHLTADEINASLESPAAAEAIRSQATTGAPSGSTSSHATPGQSTPTQSTPEQTAEEAAQNLKSVQVSFDGDQVTGYFVTPVYGHDVDLRISGHLGASNGYVTFEPTGFRVGGLDVPVSLVNPALQKKMQEPETREKLRLPDFISGLRVENSELVISETPAH
jgi:hypothetical protein